MWIGVSRALSAHVTSHSCPVPTVQNDFVPIVEVLQRHNVISDLQFKVYRQIYREKHLQHRERAVLNLNPQGPVQVQGLLQTFASFWIALTPLMIWLELPYRVIHN
jgi:hypothetical protein